MMRDQRLQTKDRRIKIKEFVSEPRTVDHGTRKKGEAFFVTGTDTGLGKTVAMFALGVLLKERGLDVGVMKPVQCGGDDAAFLKRSLNIPDSLNEINPFFAPEPLSPNLAFRRAKININPKKIIEIYQSLRSQHDVLLIEGAGGLMVPIQDDYWVADLIKELNCEILIVARLGLGTINHTLLTVEQARGMGIKIKGIIFCENKKTASGIPEKTNPEIIRRLSGVPVLGTIPYLRKKTAEEVLRFCSKTVDVSDLISGSEPDHSPPGVRVGGQSRHRKEITEWDKKYLWHPFTQMKDWLAEAPLVIDRAEGCYLIDTQGNRYLDGVSSLWVNVHGHRKKEIDRAVKAQIDKVSHSTLLGLANTPSVELAKKLVEIAPKGLTKVFYSDNGSTAVEVAIKMVYQYWQNTGRGQKTRLAHLANAYHGDTLGSVSVGGIELFHQVYKNLVIKTISVEFPDFYRDNHAEESLIKLERLFKKSHPTIAALIIEPIVQGAAGMIVWTKGILKRLGELCARYDIFLIADEVATGFGRTGKMFACDHEGVTPDFLCLAKGLTGGYLPLAATLTTQRIFDGFLREGERPLSFTLSHFGGGKGWGTVPFEKTFFHGHTYTGNPLACAAALANLEIFAKEKTLSRLQPKIKFLSQRLQSFYNLRHVGDIRQKGFMVGIELIRDRKTKESYLREDRVGVGVCQRTRERGVILRPLGNVIVLMPPLSITLAELKRLLNVTYWAIEKITE